MSKFFILFLNRRHSVILKSCWIFIYPYFESGSLKDKNLSPSSLSILEVHCILWQAALNIIPHIFIPRKTYNRLWIIFSRVIYGGEFNGDVFIYPQECVAEARVYFDRIQFVWIKSALESEGLDSDCFLYAQFIVSPLVFTKYVIFLINGQGPIVFWWISNFSLSIWF